MCVERLNKEESVNFPFMIILGRLMAFCSHMHMYFFPSGHLKDHIKIALVFYRCHIDSHKLGNLKQHRFIISPAPLGQESCVGEVGALCFLGQESGCG